MLRVVFVAGLLLLTGCTAGTPAATSIPGSCPAEVSEAVMTTIREQQRAFAQGDFTTARSYASAGFQTSVDTEQFTEIIQTRYGYLLTDPDVRFVRCDLLRNRARMTVIVKTSPEQTLTYRVVPEGDNWRIDGATASESTAVSA